MLNTTELEKRWLKYKIKSYIPHVVITLSAVIIVFTLVYLLDTKNTQKTSTPLPKAHKQEVIKSVKQVTISPKKPIIKSPVPATVSLKILKPIEIHTTQDKQITLTPSLNFMKHLQTSSLPYDNGHIEQIQNSSIKGTTEVSKTTKIKIEKKVPQTQIEKKPKVSKITIKRRNAQADIQSIIDRFHKNNNPGLSLFIAKKYYKLANYEQAYNYALITNKINSDIEGSWLIFSKSLFKLGKKDKAITTLRKYANSSHSSNAKLLLEKMLSGKFQ